MVTLTDLANAALGYIGEQKVSDIDDTGSKAARVCKQFAQDTIDEVLRGHRWNCAIARATLTQNASNPASDRYTHAYAMPTKCLRLLDVNGETWEHANEYMELEGSTLYVNSDTAVVRYIKQIGVAAFDPLLAEAVALKLAAKIAIPLTANMGLQTQMLALFDRALRKAAGVDSMEMGSRENGQMHRLRSRSALINSRFYGSRPAYDPLRFITPY
jgi:hypothetical protein